MAGYLFNLDSLSSLRLYIENGVYSTKLSAPTGSWKQHHEGTFADYITMRSGDNVYFFIERNIYGIGELVNVGEDCKYCNFPGASSPHAVTYAEVREQLLWDEGDVSKDQRWMCLFKPSPSFLGRGLDMDDVLSSNPAAFRMLRAFWKVSFMKFGDEENQAFKDVILKLNQDSLNNTGHHTVFRTSYAQTHARIQQRLSDLKYRLEVAPLLASCAEGNRLKHEMAIEAAILSQLSEAHKSTVRIFGTWDYLSHQVIASPFKPIDYMDKMDIFGYSYVSGFPPTKSRFLVIEVKKDDALEDDVEQLLKYVDWIKEEYCFGDYAMISAFVVAHFYDQSVIEHRQKTALRKYTIGRRPAKSLEWSNLRLVKYVYDPGSQELSFEIVA